MCMYYARYSLTHTCDPFLTIEKTDKQLPCLEQDHIARKWQDRMSD